MSWQSVALCDTCWTKTEGDREPTRIKTEFREVERCFDCKRETMSGISVRRLVRT